MTGHHKWNSIKRKSENIYTDKEVLAELDRQLLFIETMEILYGDND